MRPFQIITPIIPIIFLFCGCSEPEVRVYKERSNSVQLPEVSPESDRSIPLDLKWTKPEDWIDLGGSGMRLASFEVPSTHGNAELTVIRFPGEAGGQLANINRWRGQLGLAPVAQGQLAEQLNHVESEAGKITTITLQSDDGIQGILGASLLYQDMTWFFKMTGPRQTLHENALTFSSFLRSLSPQGSQEGQPDSESAEKAQFRETVVPDSWTTGQGSSMRVASYKISGQGDQMIDIAVFSFPGETGGLAANINRWRGQIGLDALDAEQIQTDAVETKISSGQTFLIHEYISETAPPIKLVGATFIDSERSWFVKCLGSEELLNEQRENIEAYIVGLIVP